ncbi:hypothetical protein VO178_13330 [Lysinibacillus fusiformis]|uniref:hypothetical protein n=1 Tax=Lysinibacillus fusiformis TaxID=28031 RepID=UPI002D775795|nr:hypothetical protein [Lysinibacillus fusiformis]WRS96369.1 hypothetical protein VO178_13330 [Lysinibacillus fusiformis]
MPSTIQGGGLLLLVGLSLITDWKGIMLSVVGLFIMMQPFQKLLPECTLSARRYLPATITSRATESYVVLTLTEVKRLPADLA